MERRLLVRRLFEAGSLHAYLQRARDEGYVEGFNQGYEEGTRDALEGCSDSAKARDMARRFLLDELAGGPRVGVEVERLAAEAGIKPRTLRRAREALGIESRPPRPRAPWVWTLPESVSAMSANERECCA